MPAKIPKLVNLDIETNEQLKELGDYYHTTNQSQVIRTLIKEKHKSVVQRKVKK